MSHAGDSKKLHESDMNCCDISVSLIILDSSQPIIFSTIMLNLLKEIFYQWKKSNIEKRKYEIQIWDLG